MNLLLIAITTALIWAFNLYRHHIKKYKDIDKYFPGPPGIPIFGNSLQWIGDRHFFFNKIIENAKVFRDTYRIWLGPSLVIMMQTPEDCQKLLSSNVHIAKSIAYKPLRSWIGEELLSNDGNKTKKMRKVLAPAFHFAIIKDFLEIFNKNAIVLVDKLKKMEDIDSFDIYEHVNLTSVDNICETAMGVSMHVQNNSDNEYVRAVHNMLHVMFMRVSKPWYLIDSLFRRSKYGKMQREALHHLHGFTKKVIVAKIEERQKEKQHKNEKDYLENNLGMKSKRAFLDIILDFYDEGTLNFEEVRELADIIMFTGHDTVSTTLSFVMYLLAHHSEYQEKVYQEQIDIFGNSNRMPTSDDLKRMKYLEMVIQESLRLFPSAPAFGRMILQEPLQLDKQRILPTGTNVYVLTLALHRRPDMWEKPDEFYPDHFLPEAVAKRHPYAYLPFSAGPRNCIGMKFGMSSLMSTIGRVVRELKLKPAKPQVQLKPTVNVLLHSDTGFMISVAKRND